MHGNRIGMGTQTETNPVSGFDPRRPANSDFPLLAGGLRGVCKPPETVLPCHHGRISSSNPTMIILATVVNEPKSGFRRKKNTVYVGRSGANHMLNTEPCKTGWLGNPYYVSEYGKKNGDPFACQTVGRAILRYKDTFLKKIKTDDTFRQAVIEKCTGKRLNCFCHPNPCHADVIAEYVNQFAPVLEDIATSPIPSEQHQESFL